MNKKIIKILTTRLFVTSMMLGITGWICLFGKELPMSYVPGLYAILGITLVASIYVSRKKPGLLRNKKIIIGLVIFFMISAIGWISAIPEITSCEPYRCGEDFICAKPTDLGLKLVTGECTSEFSEEVDFSCIKENNICIKQSIAKTGS